MSYLYSNNINVVNSVEIQNDSGNTLTTTIYYNGSPVSGSNQLPVSLGADTITITGNVNVGTVVTVNSTPSNPVHVHLTEVGNFGLLDQYIPVQGNVFVQSIVNTNVMVINTANIYSLGGYINVSNFPVSQNVIVTSLPSVNVVVNEVSGYLYALNNAAINTHRGWTMDDTIRPVISFRVNSSGTTIADIIEIIEYEIGNNNASQSTIVYEWWEGDISISGATVPGWSSVGTKSQYRIYQDVYGSNPGNTFTANGAIMRHSGVIIGKNSQNDEGPADMKGGATPNMLTLCMRRVDSGTKLDVWFAFTIKELI